MCISEYAVAPLIIETPWEEKLVFTGALEALDDQ